MGVKFTNNAYTSLATTISAGATSFDVSSAATFPTLASGDWTYVSLTNEVVKVTGISGTTFTCVAVSGGHSAGIDIELRMTAELLNDFAEDDDLEGTSILSTGETGTSKYLRVDGDGTSSWQTVEGLPSQTSQAGKYLGTDGSAATWSEVDALPSQTGHASKYLVTDGTDASWAGQIDNSVEYVATASQTSFNVTYAVGYVTAFLNGIKLPAADYTATTGTTVVLDTGATINDEVYFQAFGTFVLADTYTQAAADTLLDAKVDDSQVLTNVPSGALFTDTVYDASTTVVDADIGSTVQAYDADTAKTDTDQSWTGSQRGTVVVDNDGSFDMNGGNNFKSTPTGAVTLTFTNITNGQSGFILLVNSGGQTISAHANTKVDANLLATVTAAGTYLIGYFSDGTNVYLTNSAIYA